MREPALSSRVPSREDSLKFLRDEPAVVDLDRGPGDALSRYGVRQGGESQLVGEECVAPVTKKSEALCDAITVSEGESDQVVLRRMEDIDEFG